MKNVQMSQLYNPTIYLTWFTFSCMQLYDITKKISSSAITHFTNRTNRTKNVYWVVYLKLLQLCKLRQLLQSFCVEGASFCTEEAFVQRWSTIQYSLVIIISVTEKMMHFYKQILQVVAISIMLFFYSNINGRALL